LLEVGESYLHVLGVTEQPGSRTTQQARNLAVNPGEQATRLRLLIRHRAGQSTAPFDAALLDAGIDVATHVLTEIARNVHAELVVVGRSTKALHRLAGSLSHRLTSRKNAPVVVVVP